MFHRPQETTHLHSDMRTIRYLTSYISNLNIGKLLRTVEVKLSRWGKDQHGGHYGDERPEILFKCHISPNGSITTEDDSFEIPPMLWDRYLDKDRFSTQVGRTYPRDLEKWEKSGNLDAWGSNGDEADRIMT